MTKEFVPFDRSLKLKELGFNESCFGYYLAGNLLITNGDVYNSTAISVIKAPTFSQCFRWFREKYDLFGCIDLHVSNPIHWFIRIDKIEINDYLFHSEDEHIYFTTYEEAEQACLDKLIDIVKTK
jgi:hypothetical protein